jgi:hypothetical protein
MPILPRGWLRLACREGVDLDSCLVRGAPFGGPVAAVRDPNKIVKYVLAMEKINIFSAAGVKVSDPRAWGAG